MKITRVKCRMVTIPYKNPYRMAPGETRHKRQILVLVETDEGITGIGETGVTLIERGGETQEAIYFSIQKYMAPLVIGMDPFDIGLIIDRLEGFNQGRTGFLCAKAGIDTALYDIMGKAIGRPVAKVLGGVHRTTFKVSRSLGVKSPREMAEDAIRLKAMNYAMLTIKVGFDVKEDLNRVAAVRDAVGPDYPLEIDVNGAYNVEVAIPTLRKMERYGIEAIEQPVPWWDLQGMKEVRIALDTPVTADESAWTPQDVVNIARAGAAD
ncbi:MAG: mandelate racemase/muconate lactonizing enzyme family protein, partial [Burkholderiales bacterium]